MQQIVLDFHICMNVTLKAAQNFFRKPKNTKNNNIAELEDIFEETYLSKQHNLFWVQPDGASTDNGTIN